MNTIELALNLVPPCWNSYTICGAGNFWIRVQWFLKLTVLHTVLDWPKISKDISRESFSYILRRFILSHFLCQNIWKLSSWEEKIFFLEQFILGIKTRILMSCWFQNSKLAFLIFIPNVTYFKKTFHLPGGLFFQKI